MKLPAILMRATLAVGLLSSLAVAGTPGTAHAAAALNMVENAIFDNATSMSEAQIQAFLAMKDTVNFTNDQRCLMNYQSPDATYSPSTGWVYGANVSAAHLIYKSAQQWGINPQVIIATLQKEEALPHGNSCDSGRYNAAMGYACPSSCDPHYAGFTKQVLWGSWQLKFARMRSEGNGNLAWDGDGDITYSGRMTAGTRARSQTGATATYDGISTLCNTSGGACQQWQLMNGATASLVTYTPFYPQMFNFWLNQVIAFSGGIAQCKGTDQANVYRFWSQRFNNTHFFTTNSSERDSLFNDPNWKYEGVGFCAVTGTQTSYLPVYRFWSPRFGNSHFFTANINEKGALMSDPNWIYEGVAFYEPTDTTANPLAKTVARYWSPRFNNDHFFTATDGEKSALASDPNWRSEGTGWYAELPQP